MTRRIITISSPTMAIKASRLLNRNGIRARVIRLHPSQTPRGCTTGVEVDLSRVNAALEVLGNENIFYTGVVIL